jgi:hypothetical protein
VPYEIPSKFPIENFDFSLGAGYYRYTSVFLVLRDVLRLTFGYRIGSEKLSPRFYFFFEFGFKKNLFNNFKTCSSLYFSRQSRERERMGRLHQLNKELEFLTGQNLEVKNEIGYK